MRALICGLTCGLLFAVMPIPCFALRLIDVVTKERAKELGMEVRVRPAGPNAVQMELEFAAKGQLKHFTLAELEMREGKKFLMSSALREEKTPSGRVLVSFSADRAILDKLTLRVVTQDGLHIVYHDLRVKEFVDPEKIQ